MFCFEDSELTHIGYKKLDYVHTVENTETQSKHVFDMVRSNGADVIGNINIVLSLPSDATVNEENINKYYDFVEEAIIKSGNGYLNKFSEPVQRKINYRELNVKVTHDQIKNQVTIPLGLFVKFLPTSLVMWHHQKIELTFSTMANDVVVELYGDAYVVEQISTRDISRQLAENSNNMTPEDIATLKLVCAAKALILEDLMKKTYYYDVLSHYPRDSHQIDNGYYMIPVDQSQFQYLFYAYLEDITAIDSISFMAVDKTTHKIYETGHNIVQFGSNIEGEINNIFVADVSELKNHNMWLMIKSHGKTQVITSGLNHTILGVNNGIFFQKDGCIPSY